MHIEGERKREREKGERGERERGEREREERESQRERGGRVSEYPHEICSVSRYGLRYVVHMYATHARDSATLLAS